MPVMTNFRTECPHSVNCSYRNVKDENEVKKIMLNSNSISEVVGKLQRFQVVKFARLYTYKYIVSSGSKRASGF